MPNDLDAVVASLEPDLQFIAENIRDTDAISDRVEQVKIKFRNAGFLMFGPIELDTGEQTGVQFIIEKPLPDGTTERKEVVY